MCKTFGLSGLAVLLAGAGCITSGGSSAPKWAPHDMNRPQPAVVTPSETPGDAPSDAIVLLDGKTLDAWESIQGGPAPWKLENGYMEAIPEIGDIRTRQSFGDCQLHLEWASPAEAKGESQTRGNSGVFLMGQYEIQVLDSYENRTYPDGQAGAIYGQKPPLVNACRKPGQWQSFDIIFHRPAFRKDGMVLRPARITLFHNGVLIQDHFEIRGKTAHMKPPKYHPHADALPLVIQEHETPVRYRNIWIRPLGEEK